MKLLGLALALLVGWAAAAQERLTPDQYVWRTLHPTCIYPNLRGAPDFRVCASHLLDGEPETVIRPDWVWPLQGHALQGHLMLAKLRDSQETPYFGDQSFTVLGSWLLMKINEPHGATWPGEGWNYETFFRVVTYLRVNSSNQNPRYTLGDTYAINQTRIEYVPKRFPSEQQRAEYPWYSNQWRTLTSDQVAIVLRRIKNHVVNRQCDLGGTADGSMRDRLVLILAQDGTITARCETPAMGELSPSELLPVSPSELRG